MRCVSLWLIVFGWGVWTSMCGSGFATHYDRSVWMSGWVDADGDCQNTRHEVLARQSMVAVTWSEDGCRVMSGFWVDPYTGKAYTLPSALDIDHVVPLKEASLSGGHLWSRARKRQYAQDETVGHLVAVGRSVNRAKGSRDPSEWMPPEEAFHCEYLRWWIRVKGRYGLSVDEAEHQEILQERREHRCWIA